MDNENTEPEFIEIQGDSPEAGKLVATLVSDYLGSSKTAEDAIKNFCYVINTAGSSLAMIAMAGKYGENFEKENADELMEADAWTVSPKDIIEWLLEHDLIADKEYLAGAYKDFDEVKLLEEMFNIPSTERKEDTE